MMKKIIAWVTLIVFMMITLNSVTIVAEFRDITPQVKSASEKFSEEGLLESFIYKYGQDLFRPQGEVTRADLLLVLGEYHMLTQKLLSQSRRMLSKLKRLESASSEVGDMDEIIREFQKVLDPMLARTKTIKELKQQIGGPFKKQDVTSLELGNLLADVDRLKLTILRQGKNIDEIVAGRISVVGGRRSPDRGFNILKKEVKTLSKEIGDMSEVSLKGGKNIERRLARLEKRLKAASFAKGVKVLSDVSEEEIDSLRNEVEELRKSVYKLAHSRGRESSVIAEGFPFWARVSIGVSTLALFFMSR